MSLEHLVSALEDEARVQAEALLEEARGEAARIRREAREEAERRRAEQVEARESTWREEADRAVAEARRAGRAAVLRARDRLLDRVRERAEEMLEDEESLATYRDDLREHLVGALRPLAGRSAVITCPPDLVPDVRAALEEGVGDGSSGASRSGSGDGGDTGIPTAEDAGGRPPAEVELRGEEDAPPGLTVHSGDGSLAVDATLPERLRRLWPEIAVEVAAGAARRTGAGVP